LERRISKKAFVLAAFLLCAVPRNAVAGWYQEKGDKNKRSSDSDTLSGQVALPAFDIDGKRQHQQSGVDETTSSGKSTSSQGSNWKSEAQDKRNAKSAQIGVNHRKDQKSDKDDGQSADGAVSLIPGWLSGSGARGRASKRANDGQKDKNQDQSGNGAVSLIPGWLSGSGARGGASKRANDGRKDKNQDQSSNGAVSLIPGWLSGSGARGGTSKRPNDRDQDKDRFSNGASMTLPGGLFDSRSRGGSSKNSSNDRNNNKDGSASVSLPAIPGDLPGLGQGAGNGSGPGGPGSKPGQQGLANSSFSNSGNSAGAYWQQMNNQLNGALPPEDQLNGGGNNGGQFGGNGGNNPNGSNPNGNPNLNQLQNNRKQNSKHQFKNFKQKQTNAALMKSENSVNQSDYTNNEQNHYEEKGYPDMKEQMDARQLQTESGTDPVQMHSPLPCIGGMSAPRASWNVCEGTPQTIAQQQNPNQSYGRTTGQRLSWANQWTGNYGIGPGVLLPNSEKVSTVVASNLITDYDAKAWPFLYTHTTGRGYGISTLYSVFQAGSKDLKPDLSSIKSQFQGFTQQVGDQSGDAQKTSFQCATDCLLGESLINVANEASGAPTGEGGTRTINNVVWIVMQVYKSTYVPLSVLLVVVGAVITQVGNTVKNTSSYYIIMENPDAFQGIIRGAGALVLIFMVPLIMSWGIDIGNSMAASIAPYVQVSNIEAWVDAVCPDESNLNTQQKAQQDAAETTQQATARAIFATVQTLLTVGIVFLIGYQTVIALFFLLMGPIAAAFYAWPGSIGSLFRPVFNNWLNGLMNLILWRFVWCCILSVMAFRINWLQSIGQYDPTNPFEIYVYTAFVAMLMYVPFHALDFRPGDVVSQIQSLAQTGTAQQNS
jgi:hypothetical protein